MNVMTLLATLAVSAVDGGSECVDLPMGETMSARLCPPYLTAYSDMPESAAGQPLLHNFFVGMLKGAGAPEVEPELLQLTLGGKKLPAMRSVVDGPRGKWDATGASTTAPGTKRPRLMACVAYVDTGGTREGCQQKLEALTREPVRVVSKRFVIDGKLAPIPQGCTFNAPSLDCPDGSMMLHLGSPPVKTKEEAVAEMNRMTVATAKQFGSKVESTRINCSRDGQQPICHVASVVDAEGSKLFIATMLFNRTEGASVAICSSTEDPRVKLPSPCALVMKFEVTK